MELIWRLTELKIYKALWSESGTLKIPQSMWVSIFISVTFSEMKRIKIPLTTTQNNEKPKMAAYEDPEPTSSHWHIESTPAYKEVLPEEDLRADWTASAHRGRDHIETGRKGEDAVSMGIPPPTQRTAIRRDITERPELRITCPGTQKKTQQFKWHLDYMGRKSNH